jgi:hypothetical protein
MSGIRRGRTQQTICGQVDEWHRGALAVSISNRRGPILGGRGIVAGDNPYGRAKQKEAEPGPRSTPRPRQLYGSWNSNGRRPIVGAARLAMGRRQRRAETGACGRRTVRFLRGLTVSSMASAVAIKKNLTGQHLPFSPPVSIT